MNKKYDFEHKQKFHFKDLFKPIIYAIFLYNDNNDITVPLLFNSKKKKYVYVSPSGTFQNHDWFWSILGYIYIYLPGKIYLLARNIYSFMYSFFLENQRDLVLIISPQILWISLWICMKTLLFICTNTQIMMSTPPLPYLHISKMYIFDNNRMINRLWITIHYHPFY